MTPLDSSVQAMIIDALSQVSSKKVDSLYEEQAIASLGLDSITVMEMVGVLEDKTAHRFSDEEMARVETFGDLSALIRPFIKS